MLSFESYYFVFAYNSFSCGIISERNFSKIKESCVLIDLQCDATIFWDRQRLQLDTLVIYSCSLKTEITITKFIISRFTT